MKTRISQICIILSILFFTSCFDQPELSDVPYIEFKRLTYHELDVGTDSLVLTFSIEDGDGNVGLFPEDDYVPYHPYNVIIDNRDSIVRLVGEFEPPYYSVDPNNNRALFSEVDNRPPYSCEFYLDLGEEAENSGDRAAFIQQNPFHNNLNIDILKKISGEYEKVDYAAYIGTDDCSSSSFSARIPVFDEDNLGRTMKGEISYTMLSEGHKYVLSRDTFKVRFSLYDRELNLSNVVETPDLTLPQVQVD